MTIAPRTRTLEFGIYRDGDNNLDHSQNAVLAQALATSAKDSSVEFSVTNATKDRQGLCSENYRIVDGGIADPHIARAANMADPENLAAFVAHTLDNAERSKTTQTWIDLVDHGAGDGGGLEADSKHAVMSMPAIAQAIELGQKIHAQAHPEDANRQVDGVVANQCLMATMGFIDALSTAGVRYLAASPETMLSPGTPSTVAHAIAQNTGDASAMARSVVSTVMRTKYGGPDGYGPAAAFDVFDLDKTKVASAEAAIKTFNDDAVNAAKSTRVRSELRHDVATIDGMVRFPDATSDMPWHADRPAIAVYGALAADSSLSDKLRSDARAAAAAVENLVLAHKEHATFEPFGADYRDAAGPTIHDPVKPKQLDSWAPSISETDNAFYRNVDQSRFAQVIA